MRTLLLAAALAASLCAAVAVEPVASDCRTASLAYGPTCAANHSLYHYTGETRTDGLTGTSCAHCVCDGAADGDGDAWGDCCPGWDGTTCRVCADVAVCPPDGGGRPATNCTAGSLMPTYEEQATGKLFSCSCGGGEDASSDYICQHSRPPDRSIEWTLTGPLDAATVQVSSMAAVHGESWDKFPGQYAYE